MSIAAIAAAAPRRGRRPAPRAAPRWLAGEGEDGAVVVGVGVAVEQPGARREGLPPGRRSGRGRAPRRRWGRRAGSARSDEQLAVADERLAVDLDRRLRGSTQSRWTGTWTVPPIAAEAPKATCAVPRIFSSSRMLPVRIASSLVPIPSSATLVPSSPCAVSSSSSASPAAPVASVRWPPRTVSVHRVLDLADAGDRAVDDQRPLPRPLERRDEALAAGQVAEGAGGR